MFDWKDIWSKRFHAWVWLVLPVFIFASLMRLTIWLGWQEDPSHGEFALRVFIYLFCLVLGGIGLWRVGRAHFHLMRVARNLANGRFEARASTHWWGVTGELAEHLNTLAKMLSQSRDHQDQMVMQTTTRLRLDQERLQELNAELRRALAESRDAARLQSELFSNLSHELRTPLTAVLGYADLLQRSGLKPEQAEHLATLDRSARGMLGMINDLLDWSRIEAGKLRLHEESFNLLETVEDVCGLLAPLAYEKNLELVRILYHDVPRRLRGDEQRLRQVLTNLISNAIKFTQQGEVVVRVMREREERNRVWLRFSVSDTGIGISAEQQLALFQPFQQAGRSAGGSGLGLSITRKLSELMGGKVELESEPGRGSTFSALIPLLEVDSESARPAPDTRLRERAAWVLEPHATARLALVHWLEFWGLRVQTWDSAADLDRALAEAKPNTRPGVVIVGARESLVSEGAFLDQLRTWGSRAPLLVMVSSASLDVQARLRASGAAGCLPKSASHAVLQTELIRLSGAALAAPRLKGKLALVADNNLPNRRYVAALCESLGLEVTQAADGALALEIWKELRPEFVLLDARMPVMDGAASARAIRQLEAQATPRGGAPGGRCRIYAISAHLEPHERRSFLDAGADGILLKPFDGRQLQELLSSGSSQAPAAVSTLLTNDPEMLTLLQEELPQQFGELEAALGREDTMAARHAAHQLHGTASFYHLSALKESCASLEQRLTRQPAGLDFSDDLKRVRNNLQNTLADIRQRLGGL